MLLGVRAFLVAPASVVVVPWGTSPHSGVRSACGIAGAAMSWGVIMGQPLLTSSSRGPSPTSMSISSEISSSTGTSFSTWRDTAAADPGDAQGTSEAEGQGTSEAEPQGTSEAEGQGMSVAASALANGEFFPRLPSSGDAPVSHTSVLLSAKG